MGILREKPPDLERSLQSIYDLTFSFMGSFVSFSGFTSAQESDQRFEACLCGADEWYQNANERI
jgi:hypothetical protein